MASPLGEEETKAEPGEAATPRREESETEPPPSTRSFVVRRRRNAAQTRLKLFVGMVLMLLVGGALPFVLKATTRVAQGGFHPCPFSTWESLGPRITTRA